MLYREILVFQRNSSKLEDIRFGNAFDFTEKSSRKDSSNMDNSNLYLNLRLYFEIFFFLFLFSCGNLPLIPYIGIFQRSLNNLNYQSWVSRDS